MPAPPTPQVSVVVPHLNQPQMLARCLRSLADQRGAPRFEVIVVDNGSAEPPVAICRAFGARLLEELSPGPGPARSRGAAAAGGQILAFIDADCLADPGWIAAIVEHFRDPKVHVLGGDVRIAPERADRLTTIEAYESIYGYRMQLYVERDRYTATCNMAVRRTVFEAVGPFHGIEVAEDMEWGRRATALGYGPVYRPEMRVRTPARRNFAELARKWDRHLAHFYEQNRGRSLPRLRWLIRTVAVAASPLAEIHYIWWSPRLASHQDRWRALLGVTRLRLYRARQMLYLALGVDPAELSGGWRRQGSVAPSHPGRKHDSDGRHLPALPSGPPSRKGATDYS